MDEGAQTIASDRASDSTRAYFLHEKFEIARRGRKQLKELLIKSKRGQQVVMLEMLSMSFIAIVYLQ